MVESGGEEEREAAKELATSRGIEVADNRPGVPVRIQL